MMFKLIFEILLIFCLLFIVSCKGKSHITESQTSENVKTSENNQTKKVKKSHNDNLQTKKNQTPEKDNLQTTKNDEELNQLIKDLIEKLGSLDISERLDALTELEKIGKPAVPQLILALKNKDNSYQQTWAARILGHMKEESAIIPLFNELQTYNRLIQKLRTDKPVNKIKIEAKCHDRLAFILSLSWLARLGLYKKMEMVIPVLIELINDEDIYTREAAARTLGYYGEDERAIKPLEKIAKEDPDKDMREAALWSLKVYKKIKNRELKQRIKDLIDKLGSLVITDRAEAEKELEKIGKPAVPQLILALKFVDSYQQTSAAQTLGFINDERAIQPLFNELKTFNRLIQKLRTDKPVNKIKIEAKCHDRLAFIMSLSRLANGGHYKKMKMVIPVLIELINDEDIYTRDAAARTLGCYGDERVVKPLEKVVKESSEKYMREAALWSLNKYKKIKNREKNKLNESK